MMWPGTMLEQLYSLSLCLQHSFRWVLLGFFFCPCAWLHVYLGFVHVCVCVHVHRQSKSRRDMRYSFTDHLVTLVSPQIETILHQATKLLSAEMYFVLYHALTIVRSFTKMYFSKPKVSLNWFPSIYIFKFPGNLFLFPCPDKHVGFLVPTKYRNTVCMQIQPEKDIRLSWLLVGSHSGFFIFIFFVKENSRDV